MNYINMKLNDSLLLTFFVAILALSSCTHDNYNPVNDSTIGSIKVRVAVNQTKSRSIITTPVTDEKAVLDFITVFIMRGDFVVAEKNTQVMNSIAEVDFENVTIGGNETIIVVGNNNIKSFKGVEISEIQPTEANTGLDNIYYMGKASLSDITPILKNKKRYYVVDNVELQSIAARVEVSGQVRYNKEIVNSLNVDVITPNAYTYIFGNPYKFYPTYSPIDQANPGVLSIHNTDFYNKISDHKNVVAYHLFIGDEQRIAFRIDAAIYNVLRNSDDTFIMLKGKNDGGYEYTSPIYTDINGNYYVLAVGNEDDPARQNLNNMGSIEKQGAGLYHVKKEGDTYIVGERISSDIQLAKSSSVLDNKKGFFALVKFGQGDRTGVVDNGVYAGSKIYKIDLGKIDWNGDGKFDEKVDIYDPSIIGEGTENPVEATEVMVEANITDWNIENLAPIIE